MQPNQPVTLDLPDHVVADDVVADESLRAPAEDFATALGGAGEWEILETVGLRTVDRGGTTVRAAAVADPRVRVEVAADQGAVLLVTDDQGVLRWVSGQHDPDAASMTFEIAGARLPGAPHTAGVLERGWTSVRVNVIRFIADKLVHGAMVIQEGFIHPGLVTVPATGEDWPRFTGTITPSHAGRPATLLLLVHGIFATTGFSFKQLPTTDWGQAFLAAAHEKYDAVLGYDHRTLSVDPTTNAQELNKALLAASSGPLVVDVIAHSRGSLVTRSLAEHVLTSTDPITVRNVAMAGGPNAGTGMAEAHNWERFINLMTNLVAAYAAEFGLTLPEPLRLLAELVKAVVGEGTTKIPGLAAMDPDSEYLHALNRPDTDLTARYLAVASDFEPQDAEPQPAGWKGLVLAAADFGADEILTVANDLAVAVTSMSRINDNPLPGEDVLLLPKSLGVDHLAYFTHPKITDWIAQRFDDE